MAQMGPKEKVRPTTIKREVILKAKQDAPYHFYIYKSILNNYKIQPCSPGETPLNP